MGDLNIITFEKVSDATCGALCREDDDAVEAERSNVREVISAWKTRAIQARLHDSEMVWWDENARLLVGDDRGQELKTALAASASAGGVVQIGGSRRGSRGSVTWVTHPRRDIRIPFKDGSPTTNRVGETLQKHFGPERAEEGM